VKTGFRSLTLVGAIVLSISSVGCVVAATGTDTTDEKSQTQELDTTNTTTATTGDVVKTPDHDAVKAGGQGGGPDPSPWREAVAGENGGPDGPDPSPWNANPNTTNTRK
jgi:hypothetical protein